MYLLEERVQMTTIGWEVGSLWLLTGEMSLVIEFQPPDVCLVTSHAFSKSLFRCHLLREAFSDCPIERSAFTLL
jgi:hypothetical protein